MPLKDMKQYTVLAKEAAKKAGKLIATTAPSNIRQKGTIDFVSSVDSDYLKSRPPTVGPTRC